MAFWTDMQGQDPKRQYRWVMRIASIPAYVVKKVNKPSFTVTEVEHKYLNHTYYYPGRVTWNSVTMTIADPIDPDVASTIANIVRNSGYKPALDETEVSTISKQGAVNSLGNQIEIVQLDADGNAVETWKLINPWIKDAKFGDLDYEGDDMTDVEIELRYDWAELITASDPAPAIPGTRHVWGLSD